MIFIVLGTQKFQLNRLLKLVDSLIEQGQICDDVYAQIGNSTYIPKHYKYVCFLDKKDFEQKMEECEIVVSHSGVGTIISGLKHEKPVIVFPRLEKYGEHVDDHQLEIGESFSKNNLVFLCGENDDLLELIKKSRIHKFNKYVSQREKMITTVSNFLNII